MLGEGATVAQTVFIVTDVAGFIGSHAAAVLLARGDRVVGLDNLNDYYDPPRKRANLQFLREQCPTAESFCFVEGDIRDRELLGRLFADHNVTAVVHLAAMGGVRASARAPHLYYDVNVGGTLALLEAAVGRSSGARGSAGATFVLASTSAVYGNTGRPPFNEADSADGRDQLTPAASGRRSWRATRTTTSTDCNLERVRLQ